MEEESIASDQEDLFEHYKFQADPRQESVRIDKFLGERLANTSSRFELISFSVKDMQIRLGIRFKQPQKMVIF